MEGKKDIEDKKDIKKLVDRFYEQVRSHSLLAPVFSHVDWPAHLPVMYNFWSSILFGDQSYQGAPFSKHAALPISTTHFQEWLKLFKSSVDENFAGVQAEEIKSRAESIALVFQHKMKLIN